jgi:hypothetical protein
MVFQLQVDQKERGNGLLNTVMGEEQCGDGNGERTRRLATITWVD